MKKNKMNNEYGITLVELLAVLAISGIVITLVTSLLVTTFKQKDITQAHVDLRQEANYIVTKIRNMHHENMEYNLCYQDGKIYLDNEKKQSLASEKFRIKGTKDGVLLKNEDALELSESNPCPSEKFNPDIPLIVTLTLVDENNKEFEIDTVIEREVYNKNPSKPTFPATKEDFDDLDVDSYPPIKFTGGNCEYHGDSKTSDTVFAPTWGTKCPISKIHEGTLYIDNSSINVFSEINVDGNLFTKGSVRLDNEGKIIVGGSARIDKSLDQYSNSIINIGQNFFVTETLSLQNGAILDVGGSAQFENAINQYSNTKIDIKNNFSSKGPIKLENNAKMNVGGNAEFDGEIILNSNSNINVTGNINIGSNINLQTGAKLIVNGDAYFGGNIGPQYGNGSICVSGNATFGKDPSNYKIVESKSCGNEAGTIYLLKY